MRFFFRKRDPYPSASVPEVAGQAANPPGADWGYEAAFPFLDQALGELPLKDKPGADAAQAAPVSPSMPPRLAAGC